MAINTLKRIKVKDSDLSKVQDNVYEFSRQFNNVITDGIILTDVAIATSTTLIAHGLGRAYSGWHLIDIQGDARVWRVATSTADSTKFIPLRASAAVTVSLWVF